MSFNPKDLKITPSSFQLAMDVQDAVGNALKRKKVDISLGSNLDLMGENSDLDVGSLLQMALEVATDKEVRSCLFSCCERALYKDDQVNADFFEKVENRSLYYPIMLEVLKVNIGPLFENLSSLFTDLGAILPSESQKQK